MADILLRDVVQEMRAAFQAGKYSDALALGRHILHFYPKHLETYTLLAQVSLASNDLASANDLLRRVLSADPENVSALAGMALVSEAQEQHDNALWYLERAYEIQPTNDELRAEFVRVRELFYGTAPARIELTPGALARGYARQGQFAQAVNEFRRLLRGDSKRFDARVGLAEALYRAGRTDEAAKIAQSVMADAPFALKPNLIIGALWSENAVPEGEQFLERAHQLDPEHRVARDLLGERFNGRQAPRLPAPEEMLPATETRTTKTETADAETARASQIWTEIERPQEANVAAAEPLYADPDALMRGEQEPPHVEHEITQAPPQAEPPIRVEAPNETIIEPGYAEATARDDTLREIFQAEKASAEQEKAERAESPEPKPTSKFAERAARTRSEGLQTDAIAAAAAALASSIVIDKSKQPSPARRAHPAIPKVRPVIAGAQDRLPSWLYLSATPANAPAAFEPTPLTTADKVAPLSTRETKRSDWLVEAQAAHEQQVESQANLPDWLKPPGSEQGTAISPRTPREDIPSWLETESAIDTTQATTLATPSEPSSAVGMPNQTGDADQTTEPATPPTQKVVVESESETPSWKQVIDAELPFVSEQETRSTISRVAKETDAASRTATEVPGTNVETAREEEPVPAVETPTSPSPMQSLPDSATMLKMARDKRAAGDLKGALELYERVMHRRPNYLDQVINDLQSVVEAGGAPLTAHRLLGEAYAMAGRYKESLEHYRIAMGK